MDDLKIFCSEGHPLYISPEGDEYVTAEQYVREHGYISLPGNPNFFIKEQLWPSSSDPNEKEEDNDSLLTFTFPKAPYEIQYTEPSVGKRGPKLDTTEWKAAKCIEIDSMNLPPDRQVRFQASIPNVDVREQQLRIRISIQPFLKMDGADLSAIRLDINVLYLGVPFPEMFMDKTRLGYFPSFLNLYLKPSTSGHLTGIPLYYNQEEPQSPEEWELKKVKTITGWKVGGNIGWKKLASISAERNWSKETEHLNEIHKLISIEPVEDAAAFEWCILRWGPNGPDYNKHYGCPFPLKLPFQSGRRSSSLQLENFPTVVWNLTRNDGVTPKPEAMEIKFCLALEVEIDLIWFKCSTVWPWVKQPRSSPGAFRFEHEIPVRL